MITRNLIHENMKAAEILLLAMGCLEEYDKEHIF